MDLLDRFGGDGNESENVSKKWCITQLDVKDQDHFHTQAKNKKEEMVTGDCFVRSSHLRLREKKK